MLDARFVQARICTDPVRPRRIVDVYCAVLSLKSNSRPSEKMTFVPGSPDPIYATGAPFLAGHRMIVTSSPGLTERLVQPALARIPGLFVSMPQCTMLPFLSLTSR